MKNLFVCTIKAFLLIGLLAIVGSGQSAPDASAVNARAGTVTALLENTSDKSVLFWTSDNRPQTLADVGKFRVAPGTKRKMVVNVSASGLIKFTVSSGPPPDKSSILGTTLGSCTWRQDPRAPTRLPYIVFNGSSLTCGYTGN